MMQDESRLPAFRSQKRRRLLVVVAMFGLLTDMVADHLDASLIQLLGLAIFVGAALAVRIVSRSIADAPEELLDERQRSVQKDAYLHAYRIVGAVVAVLGLVAIGFDIAKVRRVVMEDVGIIGRGLLFLMIALPSCVLAWTERDAD
jgi:uncharacterized membrane protein